MEMIIALFKLFSGILLEFYNVVDKTPYLKSTRLATYKPKLETFCDNFICNTLSASLQNNEKNLDILLKRGIVALFILFGIISVIENEKVILTNISLAILGMLLLTSSL